MPTTPDQGHMDQECRRLWEQIERDGSTAKLSQTDLAFLQTYCAKRQADIAPTQGAGLLDDDGIDESAHIREGTMFGDPNAGTPDDPADANPNAPDPAITRQ